MYLFHINISGAVEAEKVKASCLSVQESEQFIFWLRKIFLEVQWFSGDFSPPSSLSVMLN